ncbi:hypothetical protein GCM10010297_37850 [Streptomyces malachitofuscus]|nr:hypothetical protein GCM10010297_37850 [Streptomyces malachitofuscus]
MSAGSLATLTVLAVASAWKLRQLARSPSDRSLLAVVLCLLCTAGSFSVGLHEVTRAVDALLGRSASLLLTTVLLLDTAYWLMIFVLHADRPESPPRRRVRFESALLAAVVLVLLWCVAATPAHLRPGGYQDADVRITSVAVFFGVSRLYLAYVFGTTLCLLWNHVRSSRERLLSAGLRLTALSLAFMTATATLRGLSTLARWSGVPFPRPMEEGASLLLAVGTPLLALGVSVPGVAARLLAVRAWRHRRRRHRELFPLWSLLHKAFPDSSLGRSPGPLWRESLTLRSTNRRYYRRVVECRDGLVRVSPYLADLGVREGASPEDVAAHLPRALEHQAARCPTESRAVGLALPSDESFGADAHQLAAVSRALAASR